MGLVITMYKYVRETNCLLGTLVYKTIYIQGKRESRRTLHVKILTARDN